MARLIDMSNYKASFNRVVQIVTGHGLEEILDPLWQELRTHRALPFAYPNNPKRFRTTVQATSLLSLSRCGLLSDEDKKVLQDAVILFRDSWHPDESDFQGGLFDQTKQPEDSMAWCITETPSVWSTAYALWSLIETGFEDKEGQIIQPAIDWLISQQEENTGGFPYQKYKDCIPTTYLTCLSIKALSSARKRASVLAIDDVYKPKIDLAIAKSLRFIENCKFDYDDITLFSSVPTGQSHNNGILDWISTLWAYTALAQHQPESLPNVERLFDLLGEILADASKSRSFWDNNSFVVEGHTKYGVQKTYFYFIPILLIPLIGLGLDSTSAICATFLRRLRDTFRNLGWSIPNYRRKENCTFTTALALQTIHAWTVKIAQDSATHLLDSTFKKEDQPPPKSLITEIETSRRLLKKTKKKLWSLLPYTGILSVLFLSPWAEWIRNRNPLIMASSFILFACILFFVYLLVDNRRWRTIVTILTIGGAVASLIALWYLMFNK
ncbi:TPA: hypothetical protein EYP66_11715 [Candidatus Poribacteria bacterium]|nr:hypothetical protein [Candidatus Poribacteria bacterium]